MHPCPRVLIMAIIGVICLISPTRAQETRDAVVDLLEKRYKTYSVSPIFSQIVAHRIPGEFAPAFEKATTSSYIREAVPRGESLEEWSQMITVTGLNGARANEQASALALLQAIATNFQRACPKTFAVKSLGKFTIGEYEGIAALGGCGSTESGIPRSEVALLMTVKGSLDFYSFQWAERKPPTDGAPVFDETIWKSRFQKLMPIKICDRIPNEPAPYPSCIERP